MTIERTPQEEIRPDMLDSFMAADWLEAVIRDFGVSEKLRTYLGQDVDKSDYDQTVALTDWKTALIEDIEPAIDWLKLMINPDSDEYQPAIVFELANFERQITFEGLLDEPLSPRDQRFTQLLGIVLNQELLSERDRIKADRGLATRWYRSVREEWKNGGGYQRAVLSHKKFTEPYHGQTLEERLLILAGVDSLLDSLRPSFDDHDKNPDPTISRELAVFELQIISWAQEISTITNEQLDNIRCHQLATWAFMREIQRRET